MLICAHEDHHHNKHESVKDSKMMNGNNCHHHNEKEKMKNPIMINTISYHHQNKHKTVYDLVNWNQQYNKHWLIMDEFVCVCVCVCVCINLCMPKYPLKTMINWYHVFSPANLIYCFHYQKKEVLSILNEGPVLLGKIYSNPLLYLQIAKKLPDHDIKIIKDQYF